MFWKYEHFILVKMKFKKRILARFTRFHKNFYINIEFVTKVIYTNSRAISYK